MSDFTPKPLTAAINQASSSNEETPVIEKGLLSQVTGEKSGKNNLLDLILPSQEDIENYASLSKADKKRVKSQIEEFSSELAEELAKEKPQEVLTQLYRTTAEMLLKTKEPVTYIYQNIEAIIKVIKEPKVFESSFKTVLTELANFNSNLEKLKQFNGRINDHLDVLTAATGYTRLQDHFDLTILPLLTSLNKTVIDEYLGTNKEEAQ